MQHCPICNGTIKRQTKETLYTYKDASRAIMQTGEYCQSCGEGFLSPSDLKQSKKEIADFKREVDNLLTSRDLIRIRKKRKLNQKEASRIFGGGENAFHKYEMGENTQGRPLDILLRLLDNNTISIDDIERLYDNKSQTTSKELKVV